MKQYKAVQALVLLCTVSVIAGRDCGIRNMTRQLRLSRFSETVPNRTLVRGKILALYLW